MLFSGADVALTGSVVRPSVGKRWVRIPAESMRSTDDLLSFIALANGTRVPVQGMTAEMFHTLVVVILCVSGLWVREASS